MTLPDWTMLTRPFDSKEVKWRLGGRNMALAYIDARVVMDRLDEVCGPENWQTSHICADGKTICRIGIKINDEWVWKSDGAGDTKIEADKGAVSDSIKRAAVNWGIGRYLYQVRAVNVNTEKRGNKDVISKGSYNELDAALEESANLNTLWGQRNSKVNQIAAEILQKDGIIPTGDNNTAIGNTTGDSNTAVGDNNTAIGNGAYSYTKFDKDGEPVANYTNFRSYKDSLETEKFAEHAPWREATLAEFQNIQEWVEQHQPDHLEKINKSLAAIEKQIDLKGALENATV